MEFQRKCKSIYESLPMQAALRLYMPHNESDDIMLLHETISIDGPEELTPVVLGRLKNIFKKGKKR